MPWLALGARLILSVAAIAWQKRLLRRSVGVGTLWRATYLGMAGPALVLLALGWPGGAGRAFWIPALAAGVLDAVGNRVTGAALARSDLSIFGPLNALRPALAAALGWAFLGEQPGWLAGLGLVVTAVGAALLWSPAGSSAPGSGPGWEAWRVVGWRVAGLALSVAGAAFLKRAMINGGAAPTLAVWVLAGLGVLFVSGRGRLEGRSGAGAGEGERGSRGEIAGHAAVMLAMQAMTLLVLGAVPLASAFVFFQLAMVLQVLVGRVMFGERETVRRLAACGILCAGAGLVMADGGR